MQPKTSQQAPSEAHSKPADVRGVFSTQEIRRVGTGTTTRKTVQKTFWFVEQKGDKIECQPINPNYIPSGPKRTISMDDLLAKFSPEPEFYTNSVFPKMQELQKTVASADKQRENGNNFTAEYEYSRALKVDEENVRANFGIGLTYLERGDKAKAQDIFERLVKLEAAFQPEHKHLFNDFGINLRKSKMLPQALEYYKRAQELSPNDENLYMNIARVQLETHEIDDCITNLLKALSLDPHHAPSLKFVAWLIKKNMVPEKRKAEVAAAIAASKNAPAKPTAPQPKQEAARPVQADQPPTAAATPAPAAQVKTAPTETPAAKPAPAPAQPAAKPAPAAVQAAQTPPPARPASQMAHPAAQKSGPAVLPVKNLGSVAAKPAAATPPPAPARPAPQAAQAPRPAVAPGKAAPHAPQPAPQQAPQGAAQRPAAPADPAPAPAQAAAAQPENAPKEDAFKALDGLF